MKSLKPLLPVGSLLLSSMAWAEGGSDRVFERIGFYPVSTDGYKTAKSF